MKLKNLLILLFISIVATASAQLKDRTGICAGCRRCPSFRRSTQRERPALDDQL